MPKTILGHAVDEEKWSRAKGKQLRRGMLATMPIFLLSTKKWRI